MTAFFLEIIEITLGMSAFIALLFLFLKIIGGKFTAKCRYIIWSLVILRLALPFSLGILPALIEVPMQREATVTAQVNTPISSPAPAPVYTPSQIPQAETEASRETVYTPIPQTSLPSEPEPEPLTTEQLLQIISAVYLTGACAFFLWNVCSYNIYVHRITKNSKLADSRTAEIFNSVCSESDLRKAPQLLISTNVSSPAAFGIFRRRIILPDITFTEDGLRGTLSHEITHCRRGDLYIKLLSLLARSLHWFNPLVHLASFRCEMEMEMSCDEAVLEGCSEEARTAYGEVMLDIIRRCRRNRGALTTHFNPKKNAVKARFLNIVNGSGKRRGKLLIAICLVLCLLAGTIVACRVDPDDEKTKDNISETDTSPSSDNDENDASETKDSSPYIWTYDLGNGYTLTYSKNENGEYRIGAKDESGGEYELVRLSEEILTRNADDHLENVLPLIHTNSGPEYKFYIGLNIYDTHFFELSLTLDGTLKYNGTNEISLRDAIELGVFTEERTSVTSLEELAEYRDKRIIEERVYDFYYDLFSGNSAIPEYNTFEVSDLTISFTIPVTNLSTYCSFTVTESALDTLPVGDYSWVVTSRRDISIDNRALDFPEAPDYSNVVEVQKLYAYLGSCYYYNTPTYGQGIMYPGMYNYILEYYGESGMLSYDEYCRIAAEEFGVTDFEILNLDSLVNEDGMLQAGGMGGGWFGRTVDVTEDDKRTTVVMQYYADTNDLLKSHKIAYYFGKDGTWQGYDILEESRYEPCGMVYAEDIGSIEVSSDTAKELYQTFIGDVLEADADYYSSVIGTEYLDLDANGTPELIVYDSGASANWGINIFTIEKGKVYRFTGTNGAEALAEPSRNAVDYGYWGVGAAFVKDKWLSFRECTTGACGYLLYSYNAAETWYSAAYYSFSNADGYLYDNPLMTFSIEAVNSDPSQGWNCFINGEQVSSEKYMETMRACWDNIEAQYGVKYSEENTYAGFDLLQNSAENPTDTLLTLLDTIADEKPYVRLALTYALPEMNIVYGDANGWSYHDSGRYADNMRGDYTYEPLDTYEAPDAKMISVMGDDFSLYSWENSDILLLSAGGDEYAFRAVQKYNNILSVGSNLTEWFYQAQFADSADSEKDIVIPNDGQDYLEAAQAYCDSQLQRYLDAPSGSFHKYTYASCSVSDSGMTEHLRSIGWISENTYTYIITTVFVPENDSVILHMGANFQGEYTGDDPNVPEGAYVWRLNGYITLEDDGWHGEIGGTGW